MAVPPAHYHGVLHRADDEVSSVILSRSSVSSCIVNSLVFVEAQQQMVGLIDKIGGRPFAPASVMSKLSTHMIAGSGFGQYMDWSGTEFPSSGSKGPQMNEKGKPTTLASVVETFGEHLLPMIVFPAWLLKCLPSPTMNMVGNGKEKFETLVKAMIQKIRDASQKENDASPEAARKSDLLSNLVNAPPSVSGGAFSEQDIIGNVFALSFAAEETTSSALQTGLILLAIHTDIQVELQAEVDNICANKAVGEPMDYKTDWPKMRKLMAFMVCLATFMNGLNCQTDASCSSKPNAPILAFLPFPKWLLQISISHTAAAISISRPALSSSTIWWRLTTIPDSGAPTPASSGLPAGS